MHMPEQFGATSSGVDAIASWFQEQAVAAVAIPIATDRAIMEVRAQLVNPRRITRDILDIARKAAVHTFGWPIAVVLDGDGRPRPNNTGIVARVIDDRRGSVDYWSWHEDGAFYLYKTIFEDDRSKKSLFFDTRIIRITETLMYLRNFYALAGIDPTGVIQITIKHAGLRDRVLTAANSSRLLFGDYRCTEEDECIVTLRATIESLHNRAALIELVKQFTQKLFRLYDFFVLSDKVLDDIAGNYLEGKIV